MSKHGQHVKDPIFRKRFRVRPHFTVNGITGFTKNVYRVEQFIKGNWDIVPDLEPFDTRAEAQAVADERSVG